MESAAFTESEVQVSLTFISDGYSRHDAAIVEKYNFDLEICAPREGLCSEKSIIVEVCVKLTLCSDV